MARCIRNTWMLSPAARSPFASEHTDGPARFNLPALWCSSRGGRVAATVGDGMGAATGCVGVNFSCFSRAALSSGDKPSGNSATDRVVSDTKTHRVCTVDPCVMSWYTDTATSGSGVTTVTTNHAGGCH